MKPTHLIPLCLIAILFVTVIILSRQLKSFDNFLNHLIEIGVMEYNPKTGELGLSEEFEAEENQKQSNIEPMKIRQINIVDLGSIIPIEWGNYLKLELGISETKEFCHLMDPFLFKRKATKIIENPDYSEFELILDENPNMANKFLEIVDGLIESNVFIQID